MSNFNYSSEGSGSGGEGIGTDLLDREFYYNPNNGGWYGNSSYTGGQLSIYGIRSGDSIVGSIANADISGIRMSGQPGFDSPHVDISRVTSMAGVSFERATLMNFNFSHVTDMAGINFRDTDLSGSTLPSYMTGYFGNFYFLSGQATTLDRNGNGELNGGTYLGGVLQARSFYYNNGSWYNNSSYTTPLDFDTIKSGDAIVGSIAGAYIIGMNLVGVDFSGVTNMAGTSIWYSNLTGADFSNVTNGSGSYFDGLDLTNVIYPNNSFLGGVYYLNGQATTLSETGTSIYNNKPYHNGSTTNLNGATFQGDLSGVDFSSVTSMANVIFYNDIPSSLAGVNLSHVTNMDGIVFYSTNLSGATLPSYMTGYFGNRYFLSGQETTLDQSGAGVFAGLRYENGTLLTGDFEGQSYVAGVLQDGEGGVSTHRSVVIQGGAKFFGKVKFAS